MQQDIINVKNCRIQSKNCLFDGKGEDWKWVIVSNNMACKDPSDALEVKSQEVIIFQNVVVVIPIHKICLYGREEGDECHT